MGGAPTPSSSTWLGCAARAAQPHEVRRGEVALAGPLDEPGIDPGRSVVPAGAEAEVDVS